MSLVHELEKSGNWLFRRRSWLPAVIIVLAVVYLFRNVLKREYNSITNVFIVFAIFDMVRNLAITGRVFIEPLYLGMLIAAFIFWGIVRYMVKRTKFLYVEGR